MISEETAEEAISLADRVSSVFASRWAQLPAKPLLDKQTGQPILGDDGRPRYVKILEFAGRDVADCFSAAVLAAVNSYKAVL